MKGRKFIKTAILGIVIGTFLLSTHTARSFNYRINGLRNRGLGFDKGCCGGPCTFAPRLCVKFPHLGQGFFRDYAPAPEPLEEDSESKLSVRRDNDGKTTEVANLTEKEIEIENGLTLGPRASLDLSDTGRIVSGYVITRNGIKYTDDGGLENLTEQEVQLDTGKKHVVLGPRTALDGEGNLLRGYIIVGGQGIF